MRRGGPQHPKVALLAADLGIERAHAVGVLECLWHFTAQYAPKGDVGRHSDTTIAAWIGWHRAPDELIASLQRCRFLDAHPTYRLLVHNWHHHADQLVQRVLFRAGEKFVTGRKISKKDASRRLAADYPPARRRLSSGVRSNGVAEHCVKTKDSQQEGAATLTPLSAQSGTDSKPEAKLIEEINRVSGRAFKLVEANLKFARARLVDYSLAELCAMIRWRWKTWDEGMRAQYFRPETLLNATKCESYLGSMPAAERRGERPAKAVNPELERIAARERELGIGR